MLASDGRLTLKDVGSMVLFPKALALNDVHSIDN